MAPINIFDLALFLPINQRLQPLMRTYKMHYLSALCLFLLAGCTDNSPLTRDEAVAAVEALGGMTSKGAKDFLGVVFEDAKATDEAVRLCRRIPNLNGLAFIGDESGAHLTAAGFKDLWKIKTLEGLRLRGKNITSQQLKGIRKLTRLKTLILTETQLSDANCAEIGTLPDLGVLMIADARISDAGIKHFKNIADLGFLALAKTNVTGAGLKHLAGAKSLRNLILSYSPIDDAGLENIAKLSGLNHLNLMGTKVTDKGIMQLVGLRELGGINLTDTKVTPEGAKAFQKLWKEGLLKAIEKGEIVIEDVEERGVRIILK